MSSPNTLISVDVPTTDPGAAATFSREVFGREVEPRPADVFHRTVPCGHFPGPDGAPSVAVWQAVEGYPEAVG